MHMCVSFATKSPTRISGALHFTPAGEHHKKKADDATPPSRATDRHLTHKKVPYTTALSTNTLPSLT